MLDAQSPLVGLSPFMGDDVALREAPDFVLTQVSGFGKAFEKDLSKVIGKLPASIGLALSKTDTTIFRIGPAQFWLLSSQQQEDLPASCLTLPLSSSRCRMELSGAKARMVLSRCAPIDFVSTAFKPDQFVLTGIHHTPVMIHCITENTFHIYALRTFAVNVWEWLADCVEGLV